MLSTNDCFWELSDIFKILCLQPGNVIPRYLPKGNETIATQKPLHSFISFLYYCLKLEISQIAIKFWIAKLCIYVCVCVCVCVCIYYEILFSNKKGIYKSHTHTIAWINIMGNIILSLKSQIQIHKVTYFVDPLIYVLFWKGQTVRDQNRSAVARV
jgi:hypothetical protein